MVSVRRVGLVGADPARRRLRGLAPCVSATFCLLGENDGQVAIYNGTTVGDREPALTGSGVGWAVPPCTSATACVASDNQQYTATYNGTTWTARTDRDATVTYLSCPTGTKCVGLGGSFSGGDAAAGVFDGQAWGAFTPVDTTEGRRALGLSCPSLTFCVGLETDGFVVTYDGSAWSSPLLVDPVNTPTGLACRSLSFCAAVDAAGAALTYNGTSWTAPARLDQGHSLTVWRAPAPRCASPPTKRAGSCASTGRSAG